MFVEIGDFRQRTGLIGFRGLAYFGAFADQTHAKALVTFKAITYHIEITRFENAQWQLAFGKQHGAQGKDGNRNNIH